MPYEYRRQVKGGGAGAKEGLDKKMNYWADKDYQYEFGVTVGMALNQAASRPNNLMEDMLDTAFVYFKLALEAKLDPRFIEIFNEYYSRKKHLNDIPVVEITKE